MNVSGLVILESCIGNGKKRTGTLALSVESSEEIIMTYEFWKGKHPSNIVGDQLINNKDLKEMVGESTFYCAGDLVGTNEAPKLVIKMLTLIYAPEAIPAHVCLPLKVTEKKQDDLIMGTFNSYTPGTTPIAKHVVACQASIVSQKVAAAVQIGSQILISGYLSLVDGSYQISHGGVTFLERETTNHQTPITPPRKGKNRFQNQIPLAIKKEKVENEEPAAIKSENNLAIKKEKLENEEPAAIKSENKDIIKLNLKF